MRYVSAYMLAVLGGKEKPSASDLENILGSVGIDADAEKVLNFTYLLENFVFFVGKFPHFWKISTLFLRLLGGGAFVWLFRG